MRILAIIIALGSAAVLIRVWTGVMNVQSIDDQNLAHIEKKHPYLPKFGAIIVSVLIAGLLFILSIKYGKNTSLSSLTGSSAFIRSIIVFSVILGFGIFDQMKWSGSKERHKFFYAFVLGTLVTWILIAFKRAFFETGIGQDPFLMALGITCVIIGWKFLFGPWNTSIKATVLGTFLFWVTYALLRYKTPEDLLATAIAAVFAIIPVVIWCTLFLSYHRERFNVVLLAFFAGMLSVVPILFYSELMSRGIELNFFLFKITPLSFGSTSREFVNGSSFFTGISSKNGIVFTTLITYLIVGVIEETSKFWVLKKSSADFFRSIDDTLQLSIVVALGFAFAENLVNPTYFVGFVKQYLILPASPMWGPLIGSVFGRAILTTMVHVLSTGVLGYFFGLAFFATPLLRDQFKQGKGHRFMWIVHRMLSVRTDAVFARTQIMIGLLLSFVIHGVFDFIVTLPEVLPNNPHTVGALLGSPPTSFLSSISITLIPALLYVIGGFWLLTYLFQRKEDMKHFGAVVQSQSFVSTQE